MPQRGYRGKTGKRKRRGSRTAGSVILLFAVFLLIGTIVFFRVRSVDVQGAVVYTEEEIVQGSGVNPGENLLFLRGAAVSERLFDSLPYLESVRVAKKLPGTLVITVTERRPVACVFAGGSWWLLDSSCKVLEKTNSSGIGGCIRIEGLTVEKPEPGEILSSGPEDTITGEALAGILGALIQYDLCDKISELQAESLSAVSFEYDGRIHVDLGTYLNAQQKLGLMNGILAELPEDARGRLDLSRGDEGRFVPD